MLDVLVVDNYDSFTWNLIDLLESCPDTRCHVITNDQEGWTTADLPHVDAVVISPEPGHAADPQDFGRRRERGVTAPRSFAPSRSSPLAGEVMIGSARRSKHGSPRSCGDSWRPITEQPNDAGCGDARPDAL